MSVLEPCHNEGIDVTDVQDGGVIKVIIREGIGTDTPSEGADVVVHYVGKFLDGTQFDSSRDKGKPLDFLLGKGQVIAGWELGLETMKKREICTLTLQPEYAYGKAGRPPTIPPNETLVFEIELIEWVDEKVTFDSLVTKKVLKKGQGSDHADDGGTVKAHIIGRDGDRVFDERDVQFVVSEGMSVDVIPGVDSAVKTMKKGEISMITSDCSHAFGQNGRPEWGIAPGVPVMYEVHLKSFEQLKQPWELSSEERIESAKIAKEKGIGYFKQEKYSLALSKFSRLVSLVESLTVVQELQEMSSTILAGHLNVALCYLKLGKYAECMEACDKALYRDENNIKGLYRKARAQFELSYWDESKELFHRVLKLDPNNKDARYYYSIVKKKLDEYKEKEKKVFSNMFDKFAAQDAKHLAKSQEKESKYTKDVFERAKEEANMTFGDTAMWNSNHSTTSAKNSKTKTDNTMKEDVPNSTDDSADVKRFETNTSDISGSSPIESGNNGSGECSHAQNICP